MTELVELKREIKKLKDLLIQERAYFFANMDDAEVVEPTTSDYAEAIRTLTKEGVLSDRTR